MTRTFDGEVSFETEDRDEAGALRWAMPTSYPGWYYIDAISDPGFMLETDDAIRYVATGLVEP